jgi:hypothetical protein
MLDNLTAAARIRQPDNVRTGVEFDGYEGTAVTPGYDSEPENFDEFLLDAGLDPHDIEVIPPVRTSRWQQQRDGELIWLTSYRFTFRRKRSQIDLPLLIQEARQKAKKPKEVDTAEAALVVLWSDLQVGKVDVNGDTVALIERVERTKNRLVSLIKRVKPSRLVFADLGDTIENFDNVGREQQRRTNDLSLMDQVDLATTLAWQTLKLCSEKVPQVTYASVGSNHCQWRLNGKPVGKATDDWGVFIGRQLARLAQETGAENIRFVEPHPYDESLALDVFEDGYHILGLVHGHQANRPEGLPDWWRKQAFGAQPVKNASILVHGHFHHLRLQELGSVERGDTLASRYLIGAPTMDNGSTWYRQNQGEDSQPGLATFTLYKAQDFTGTVWKL